MNSCQMNISNSSAPPSPSGISTAATTINSITSSNIRDSSDTDEAAENTQTKLARSKSLDEISLGDSPKADLQPPPVETGLKVKIRTNNIINKPDLVANNDSNNNTSNTANSEGINNKPTNSNKTGSRKSKPNNGELNSDNSSTDTTCPANHSPIGETTLSVKLLGMNNHGSSSTENGNQSSQSHQSAPPPLSLPTPQPQLQPEQNLNPIQFTQQPIITQPQFQQSSTPSTIIQSHQSQPTPTQQTPSPMKASSGASNQTESKPKTTRTRKPAVAAAKNVTASNVVTKPEPKRKSKAKQNAETKAAAAESSATTLAPPQTSQALSTAPSPTSDKKSAESSRQTTPTSASKKRKPRSTPANEAIAQPTNPPKRTRKKKADQAPGQNDNANNPLIPTNVTLPLNVANPQLLTVASSMPMGLSPSMTNMHSVPSQQMQPLNIQSNRPGVSPLDIYDANRLYMTMPYPNSDPMNASSLTRPSLSRLFTSSSSTEPSCHTSTHPDEIAKAFEELKDNVWSQVSRSVIELAQHFDIPSLIGTLYTLRQENEKLVNKVRDLTAKRDQLIATNARFDLPGPLLTQHLSHTSPNFSSVVASLTNSPKSLANSSPSPAMNKSPLVSGSSYNHVPPGSSLGPPGYGRNSPLIGIQTQHSGVNSLKSSIPLPSPPTGALLAHGANNRAGLMTVNNPPYMTNIHPSMNALNQLGGSNTPSSSYYTRQ